MATDKGYTGQFHDAVSGLDYYNARYYDPVRRLFLVYELIVEKAGTMAYNLSELIGKAPGR